LLSVHSWPLATCQPVLSVLAGKYCLVHGLLQYTEETIKQIKEAWETILLELASYAENNPPGIVAVHFLELLMFGVMISPQLEIVVGVMEDVVERALYRRKGVELQQVIDESMKNLKVFFRWIYVEILRLSDKTGSGDLSKVSHQVIAEFIQRFQPLEGEGGVSHVYLEKVGQYMAEEELVQFCQPGISSWRAAQS